MKNFDDVKAGDKGITFADQPVTIIAKAKGKKDCLEQLSKYDDSGWIQELINNPDDYGIDDVDTMELVAAEMEFGVTFVYCYGDGGVEVA
jgi:hypothetical protein